MNFRQVLKQSDYIVSLLRDFRKIRGALSHRSRIIADYLTSNELKKLQLGAGTNVIDSWLCTDIAPKSDHVMYLNATKPLPFNDNTFDYVYSEHMIEHISWHDGLMMLKECQRVLKPGGTIRIATPDLAVFIGLYIRNDEPLSDRFISWVTNTFLTGIHVYKASFVINNVFRNWGHQFLYDGELMEMALQEAGFTNIQRCSPGESDDENLREVDNHGKVDEIYSFETMVYEGKSPG